MSSMPHVWTDEQLARDASIALQRFRENRIDEPEQLYVDLYADQYGRVLHVLNATKDLLELEQGMPALLANGYYDVVRYLSAPPISEDDMHVVAELTTKSAPSKLALPQNASKIVSFVRRTLDAKRFGWVGQCRRPTDEERRVALVASASLLATQQVQTLRRGLAKRNQEGAVKAFLSDKLRFHETKIRRIDTAFDAPKAREFCGETPVAGKKADVVVGLGDNRFMCIECKVSNSTVNSFKRLNHETIEKTVHWYRSFGVNGGPR